jgi:hypothetical protein
MSQQGDIIKEAQHEIVRMCGRSRLICFGEYAVLDRLHVSGGGAIGLTSGLAWDITRRRPLRSPGSAVNEPVKNRVIDEGEFIALK